MGDIDIDELSAILYTRGGPDTTLSTVTFLCHISHVMIMHFLGYNNFHNIIPGLKHIRRRLVVYGFGRVYS